MKKNYFKHLVAALFVGTILTTNAGNGSSIKTGKGDGEKTIQQQFLFPNIILPVVKNEKVQIVFTLNKENRIDVVIVKTEDTKFKKEIENQLSDLVLPSLKANSSYSIIINFKRY
jgi:hypothetical protein